jgi:SAM-dependent methyltransferase
MRKNIKRFVKITAKCQPFPEPIYEFGALQVPGQERYADLRPIFPECNYVGTDMREGPGVDRILNLHNIDLPSESVGSALCLDTLEHVEYPHQAMQEIHRILSPTRGIAVISSVMNFRIHAYPHDYWRFTPSAFESLLKPFKHSFVGFAGKESFPHTIVGVGFKHDAPDLSELNQEYQRWQDVQKYDFEYVVRQIVPPALLQLLAKPYSALAGLTKAFRK